MLYQLGNYNDDLLEGLKQLAGVVHSRGSIVIAQLVHTEARQSRFVLRRAEIWVLRRY